MSLLLNRYSFDEAGWRQRRQLYTIEGSAEFGVRNAECPPTADLRRSQWVIGSLGTYGSESGLDTLPVWPIIAVASVAILAGLYARFVEPRWLRVRQLEVRIEKKRLTASLRALHFSDFHWSRAVPLAFIEQAVEQGLAEKPELICITGDFITVGQQYDLERYVPLFERLVRAAPCFAVFGNHDGGEWTEKHGGFANTAALEEHLSVCGVRVLNNESVTISVSNVSIVLVGTADLWSGSLDVQRAFGGATDATSTATLLLSHTPDAKESVADHPWDLMLSGHTHGGQLVIPLLGSSPWAPVKDKAFVSGLNSWNGRQIHTTPGIGNFGGIRFNCRPEVSVLNLRPQ